MLLGAGGISRLANAGGFVDYLKYDGLGLADLVRRGEIKPEELIEAAISRIETMNPRLNAVVTKMYDEAKKTIATSLPDGPFKAVPFLFKDLGAAYAGVKLTMGCKFMANYVPNYDNELVKRYKKAALICVGPTNTPFDELLRRQFNHSPFTWLDNWKGPGPGGRKFRRWHAKVLSNRFRCNVTVDLNFYFCIMSDKLYSARARRRLWSACFKIDKA